MARIFTLEDFLKVKRMQNSGWKKPTIITKMAELGWSVHTVERAMTATSYTLYKHRIARDTRTIRARRTAERFRQPLAKLLIDDGPRKLPFVDRRKTKRSIDWRPVLLVIVVLTLMALYVFGLVVFWKEPK